MTVNIHNQDCMEFMKTMPNNTVDAVVTDPPYGLSFMGKKWDYDVPSVEIWRECLRVLKPGGYLLSFAGTRTQHRMACNIEDAGFEIRDMIAWVYGSGFPKSLNIGKAVDKLQGNKREDLGIIPKHHIGGVNANEGWNRPSHFEPDGITPKRTMQITKGTSEFEGWGTALKPAHEPITVARKPIEKGLSVAENCLKWGTGGINIDSCRIEVADDDRHEYGVSGDENPKNSPAYGEYGRVAYLQHEKGRFPSNFIHDGSQEVLSLFPVNKSTIDKSNHAGRKGTSIFAGNEQVERVQRGDSGSAARFFYCAKASKSERNRGCEGLENKDFVRQMSEKLTMERTDTLTTHKNNHPTVKPISLMEYLVKLVTREGQTVLDPFAGSGTTGISCTNLNRNAILIDREAEYVEIAKCRNI